MTKRISLALALLLPFAAACSQQEEAADATPPAAPAPAEPAPPPPAAMASIRTIMSETVAPAADAVWGAVAVTSTADGLVEEAPETDEEWNAVRDQALALVEAADQLMTEGRPVKDPDETLLDEGLEGNLTVDQIQEAITTNRNGFNAFAQAFRSAAEESLAAIEARDTQRLSDSGGGLDEACENCHITFWYPPAP